MKKRTTGTQAPKATLKKLGALCTTNKTLSSLALWHSFALLCFLFLSHLVIDNARRKRSQADTMNLRSLIAPDYGKISPNFSIIQSQWKALKWGQIQACGWMNWNSFQQKLRHIIPQIKVCQGAQNHWWWCQISCVLVRFLVLSYALLHSFKLPCALLSCTLLRSLVLSFAIQYCKSLGYASEA